MDELVKALRAHALANYEKGGWDVIVECWSDEEIAKQLTEDGAVTLEDAIKSFAPQIEVWAERQAEADSYREPVDDFVDNYDGGYNEIDQGRWDDDPSPYDGTYSEE